jgi:ABC-2 type transport system ATP-binding protein
MKAIQAQNLTRKFNGVLAVDDLTFEVEAGEIFGFLGPNGAGKTTTIRMLTGQLLPTAGSASVAGCDILKESDALHRRIGVVSEYQNLYERMSGRENLLFSAILYGVNRARVDELIEQVGMGEHARKLIKHYSNGMKQRLLIARALLHFPEVLFLDEPTRGLDPGIAVELRRMIHQLSQEGVTIFLTTHYMEEADHLCSRVAFLEKGRIVALDAPQRLKTRYGKRTITVQLEDGRKETFPLDGEQAGRQLGDLVAAGRISSLRSDEADLEQIFIQLTGRRIVE